MAEASPERTVRRLWRAAPASLEPAGGRRPQRCPWQRFLLLAFALMVFGAWCGLLTWLRPAPLVRLVPLWTTSFQERLVPDRPFAERDRLALVQGGCFTVVGPSTGRQQAFAMQEILADAARRDAEAPLVVYLSTYAAVGAKGELELLCADFDVDQPHSRLPLRRVLERLRDCPAENKLLVLDIMAPGADVRLGILADEAAGYIEAELAEVADPDRLVLCAASPKEVSLESEDIGRTIFGYYFETGLAGWADGFGTGRPDGRVSVQELAAYVSARVGRWSRVCRGVAQTPRLLGSGADFVLFLPAYGRPLERRFPLDPPPASSADAGKTAARPAAGKATAKPTPSTTEKKAAPEPDKAGESAPTDSAPVASAKEDSGPLGTELPADDPTTPKGADTATEPRYPAWLLDGWTTRDQWRRDGVHRSAPRVFARLEAALLQAERRFRAGEPDQAVQNDLADQLALLARLRDQFLQLPAPRPCALVQLATAEKADPAVGTALDQLLAKLKEQPPPAKPEEAAKARQALSAEFAKPFATLSTFAYAAPIFAAAVNDRDPSIDEIALFDELLQARRTDEVYVETLLLHRLAEKARSQQPWSPTLVHRLLKALDVSERILGRTAAFTWLGERLEAALQARHDAQVALLESPTPALAAAGRRLAAAERLLVLLDAQSATIEEALRLLDDALTLLPVLLNHVADQPSAPGAWETVTDAYRKLADLLDRTERAAARSDEALRDEIAHLHQQSDRLRVALADLERPLSAGGLEPRLDPQAQKPAGPELWRALQAVLATPVADGPTRASAWTALRQAEHRLNQQVFERDVREDARRQATAQVEVVPLLPALTAPEAKTRRVRLAIALLRCAGYPEAELAALEKRLAGTPPASDGRWYALSQDLAQVWNTRLPALLRSAGDLRRLDRLARIAAAEDVSNVLDDAARNPTVRLRQERLSERNHWVGEWFAYGTREPGPAEFYADLAQDYRRAGAAFEPPLAAFTAHLDTARAAESDTLTGAVDFTLRVPSGHTPALSLGLVAPDEEWIRLEVDAAALALPETPPGSTTQRAWHIPFRLAVRAEAAPAKAAAPAVLLRLVADGRSFHRLLHLPPSVLPAFADLDVLLGFDGSDPKGARSSLRLPPTGAATPVYTFLRNRSAQPRRLTMGLETPVGPIPLVAGPVSIGQHETLRIDWKPGAAAAPPGAGSAPAASTVVPAKPAAAANLPEFHGPLLVRLSDDSGTRRTVAVEVAVAEPRAYVEVASALFEPARSGGANRLQVVLRRRGAAQGLPIAAELALPRERIPGLIAVREGTLRGTMAADDAELVLSAGKLLFEPGLPENGWFYVHVDGYPRAFVFQTTFVRAGDPTTPREDLAPQVRLRAPQAAASGPNFTVALEADNAPAGAQVLVTLSRSAAEPSTADLVRSLPSDRQRIIGFDPKGKEGALVFSARVEDWQAALDTTGIQGRRRVTATLVDPGIGPVASAARETYLDPRPPANPRFVEIPAKARAGSTVPIQAGAEPGVTPIAAAVFFVGKPAEGKVPPGALSVPGRPIDETQTVWGAALPLPEQSRGPLEVSVLFTNRAGLSDVATAALTVVDKEAPIGLGSIAGKVMEGDRPQPGLEVVLTDDKGTPLAKVKTQADGSFRFADVKPGKYLVKTSKPQSRRSGQAAVLVVPDRTTPVALALYL